MAACLSRAGGGVTSPRRRRVSTSRTSASTSARSSVFVPSATISNPFCLRILPALFTLLQFLSISITIFQKTPRKFAASAPFQQHDFCVSNRPPDANISVSPRFTGLRNETPQAENSCSARLRDHPLLHPRQRCRAGVEVDRSLVSPPPRPPVESG